MLFLAPVFCFALSNVVFVYVGEPARERSIVTPIGIDWLMRVCK